MWCVVLLSSTLLPPRSYSFFFFHATATTDIYTLSLHDALPISRVHHRGGADGLARRSAQERVRARLRSRRGEPRSEEHTSELQSHSDLVCRLLLEKKKKSVILRN